MKIYRTEAALFEETIEMRVVEMLLCAHLDGKIMSFDDFGISKARIEVHVKFLQALSLPMVSVKNKFGVEHSFPKRPKKINQHMRILASKELDFIFSIKPECFAEAMHFCGLYTDAYLSIVPPGTKLFSLSDEAEELIEENGVEKVAGYIATNMNANVAKAEGVN